MRPLTLDDLMPLEEFAGRRRELFLSLGRYLERHRRVRIGPHVTLIFENRQTLWFRLQDLLRIARVSDPGRVQEELDLYNPLLPTRDCLQAALVLGNPIEPESEEERKRWQPLRDENLQLHLGRRTLPARLVTCRPEDRAIGAAHWVNFVIAGQDRRDFANFRIPVRFAITLPAYSHESATLSEDIRQSLLDDLKLSDRDERRQSA